jgi:hypothetical protein
MAYVQNEDELKQGGAGGQVLSGSGGAGAGPAQAVGSGFTNLQKYLSANQGQGGGVANDITAQGQEAVNTARTAADTQANAWADSGVQAAETAANNAANTFNTATANLKADPNADVAGVIRTTYDGPQNAQSVEGFNDLDKAYQNVKNTASSFANDRMTQQAGLQKKYGYGSGFAALDGFLGRQDGRDQINNWAAGVDSGSSQGAVDRVNTAITGGKQKVVGAQFDFNNANAQAKNARSAEPQNPGKPTSSQAPVTGGRGIADVVNDPQEAFAEDKTATNKRRTTVAY